MAQYSVSPRAYALALLHAAKYPDAQVCGLLLGSLDKDGEVNVTTGLPLFHHWASLTPMLEVALTQAEQFAAKRNEKIVGWYQANADLKDTSLHESAVRIANTIRQNAGNCIIFIVNNEKLSDMENVKDGSAIVAYSHSENQWRAVKQAFAEDSTVSLTYEETYAKVRGMLSSAAYNRLIDFDEHLEDITQDWLAYATEAAWQTF